MKKILLGTVFGAVAGIIDVIPMIAQKLTWDANISAFSFWVVSGFFISTSNIKLNPVLKGIIISFITLIPCAIIIGAQNAFNLLPVGIMTFILSSILGFVIGKIKDNS